MAQLSDDCFAFGGELLQASEALAILESRLHPVMGAERVTLDAALGRIAAVDIVAPRDVPPHDNSAVDGFAVYFDDLSTKAPTRLPVGARIAAGHPLPGAARRGTAYRVFTGAPMPKGERDPGPETVLMQEDCTLDGDEVEIPHGIARGANCRKRGEDISAGEVALPKGRRLRPQDIGLAASLGFTEIDVYERLRVAVFSTGDEVRDPGAALPEGCIYDSNRHGLAALLQGLGCRVDDLGILPDDEAAIRAALADAAENHDLLLTSGGVSTGEEDHVRAAVDRLGEIQFWRLAIRPGRPIAFGRVRRKNGEDCAFIGLPGNPVAVMVTFLRFARPAILRLAGAAGITPLTFPVVAGFTYKKRPNRMEWVRARLSHNGAGAAVAKKHPKEGAGMLTSMTESDGLVEIPAGVSELKEGETVTFLPFSEVLG